jgi:hypothetical protein
MNWETLYQISNFLTLPFWLLIIFLPHWKWTRKIISSLWIIAPAALLYSILIIPQLPLLFGAFDEFSQPSLASVAAGLSTPEGALVEWIHLIAFDLLVGRWIYLDSRPKNRNSIWIGIILFFTFILGPLGFLLYLLDNTFIHGKTATNQQF